MMSADSTILVAEDSEDDRYILTAALRAAEIPNPVQYVNDGRQAVAYLSGADRFADRGRHPLPALVILDFKMPVMSGIEVLDLHVNAYVMKPSTLEGLVSLMRAVGAFWLACNEYPIASEA